jgi:hypothetical protein
MPDEDGAISSDTWIDISHESFMRLWTKLREWADEEAEFAREYRRSVAVAAGCDNGDDTGHCSTEQGTGDGRNGHDPFRGELSHWSSILR